MADKTKKYELARSVIVPLVGVGSACILTAIGAGLHSPLYHRAVGLMLICLIFNSAFFMASHMHQDFRFFGIVRWVSILASAGTIFGFCMFIEAYKADLGKIAGCAIFFSVMMLGFCLKSERELKAQRIAEAKTDAEPVAT